MNKFLFLLFFISISLFSQKEKDSITAAKIDTLFIVKDSIKKNIRFDLFSDSDLKTIDSLLIDEKFNSSLVDTLEYVIGDKDIIGSQNIVLTTALLKKRLSDLDEQTPFNLAFNPALEKVINSYLLSRSKYYPKLMAKAKYYFPMFEQYLDQYDIPLEMKYLAIVESALRPQVKSRVGATGLWQFMYLTGKQYGLERNWYIDERQDPEKSTKAAAKYFKDLYKIKQTTKAPIIAPNSTRPSCENVPCFNAVVNNSLPTLAVCFNSSTSSSRLGATPYRRRTSRRSRRSAAGRATRRSSCWSIRCARRRSRPPPRAGSCASPCP